MIPLLPSGYIPMGIETLPALGYVNASGTHQHAACAWFHFQRAMAGGSRSVGSVLHNVARTLSTSLYCFDKMLKGTGGCGLPWVSRTKALIPPVAGDTGNSGPAGEPLLRNGPHPGSWCLQVVAAPLESAVSSDSARGACKNKANKKTHGPPGTDKPRGHRENLLLRKHGH